MRGPERPVPERPLPLAAATTAPATRTRFLVLAVGCGLAFLAYVHRQSFVRAQPYIADNLGLNDQQFGYLTAAFLIGYGLFQVPCGLLSDRFDAQASAGPAGDCLVCFSPGCRRSPAFLPSGSSPLAYLIATRFAFGVAQAGYFPVWSRVMADWMPVSERGTAQGPCGCSAGWAEPSRRFSFGGLFKLSGTWTTPLWVLAALGPCCAIPFWIWFRNRPDEMPRVNAAERAHYCGRASSRPRRVAQGGFRGAPPDLGQRLGICLMYGLVGSAGNFVTTLLPNYLDHTRHLSKHDVTWITAAPLALGVVSCALGGVLSDWIIRRWGSRKWGRRANAAIGLLLAGLSLSVIPWVGPVSLIGAPLQHFVLLQRPDDRPGVGRLRRRRRTLRRHDRQRHEHDEPTLRGGGHGLRRLHDASRRHAHAVSPVRLRSIFSPPAVGCSST